MRDFATRAKQQNTCKAVSVQGVYPDRVDFCIHDAFELDHETRHCGSIADNLEDGVLHPLPEAFQGSGNLTQAALPHARGGLDVVHHQEVHRTTLTCAS